MQQKMFNENDLINEQKATISKLKEKLEKEIKILELMEK